VSRRLKASVVVGSVVHEAGSEPPDDVADQITNPDAWEDQADDEAAGSEPPDDVADQDKQPRRQRASRKS
jgi:hypothetical protein